MVTVAKDGAGSESELPSEGGGRALDASTMTLAGALDLECLIGAQVVAGAGGLDRPVSRVNVMEVPDILPWVQEEELLLTTGFALRNDPERLAELIPELKARNLAGFGIKLGRYINRLPERMLTVADELDFPVIVLPDGAAYDEIIEGVLRTVHNPRMSMLERAEDVLRTLVDVVLRGGDLDEVCRRLVAHGFPVAMVTTTDGRVLARAGESPEVIERAERRPCFDETGRFRVEDTQLGLPRPGAAPGGTADPTCLVARISAGTLDHGRLVIFADRPLGNVDLHLLERSAEAAALVITKGQAVAAVETKYRADFLRDTLAGTAGSAEQVIDHASSLGWDLSGPLLLVVTELDSLNGSDRVSGAQSRSQQDRFAASWTQAVKLRLPAAAVVGRGQEVVTVMRAAADASREEVTKTVAEIARAVRGVGGGGRRNFSTGVSRVVPSVDGLPTAYAQARKAVAVGRQIQGAQSLIHFDALGVFRLLALVPDSDELRSFVAETLGELATDASPDSADLRETLAVLLDNNLNVAETARTLHFHYNTLRYRIAKLERMLGPFTSDPHLRLTLSLALRVVQMRGL